MEEIGLYRENEMFFVPFIPFFECKLYTQCTTSFASANQRLREIGQYEEDRQK